MRHGAVGFRVRDVTPRMRALRLFSGKWAALRGPAARLAGGLGILACAAMRIMFVIRKWAGKARTYVGKGRAADDRRWRRGYIAGYQAGSRQQAGKSRAGRE
jgi:hypothetical protein